MYAPHFKAQPFGLLKANQVGRGNGSVRSVFPSSSVLRSSLELSNTKVYEP